MVCQHDHEHCHLEGSASGYGARTSYMENYQPGMAATLAAAIMQPEAPPHHWETAHAVSSAKATQSTRLMPCGLFNAYIGTWAILQLMPWLTSSPLVVRIPM